MPKETLIKNFKKLKLFNEFNSPTKVSKVTRRQTPAAVRNTRFMPAWTADLSLASAVLLIFTMIRLLAGFRVVKKTRFEYDGTTIVGTRYPSPIPICVFLFSVFNYLYFQKNNWKTLQARFVVFFTDSLKINNIKVQFPI